MESWESIDDFLREVDEGFFYFIYEGMGLCQQQVQST